MVVFMTNHTDTDVDALLNAVRAAFPNDAEMLNKFWTSAITEKDFDVVGWTKHLSK